MKKLATLVVLTLTTLTISTLPAHATSGTPIPTATAIAAINTAYLHSKSTALSTGWTIVSSGSTSTPTTIQKGNPSTLMSSMEYSYPGNQFLNYSLPGPNGTTRYIYKQDSYVGALPLTAKYLNKSLPLFVYSDSKPAPTRANIWNNVGLPVQYFDPSATTTTETSTTDSNTIYTFNTSYKGGAVVAIITYTISPAGDILKLENQQGGYASTSRMTYAKPHISLPTSKHLVDTDTFNKANFAANLQSNVNQYAQQVAYFANRRAQVLHTKTTVYGIHRARLYVQLQLEAYPTPVKIYLQDTSKGARVWAVNPYTHKTASIQIVLNHGKAIVR